MYRHIVWPVQVLSAPMLMTNLIGVLLVDFARKGQPSRRGPSKNRLSRVSVPEYSARRVTYGLTHRRIKGQVPGEPQLVSAAAASQSLPFSRDSRVKRGYPLSPKPLDHSKLASH